MHDSALVGDPGEVTMTIEIKRADTGVVETYDLVGHITEVEETTDGSNPHDSGA
jgi:hypothetical protein